MSSAGKSGLEVFCSVSNNLAFRDKSVKVLQYASRMLLGWYGDSISSSTKDAASALMTQCAQARKAFRLLKSINMLNSLVRGHQGTFSPLPSCEFNDAMNYDEDRINIQVKMYRELARRFEAFELLAMLGYYGCDNVLFLGRAKVLTTSYNALFWETATFSCWAANDFIAIIRNLLLLWTYNLEISTAEQNDKLLAAGSDGSLRRSPRIIEDIRQTSLTAHSNETAENISSVAIEPSRATEPPTTQNTPCAQLQAVLQDKLLHLYSRRRQVLWALIKSLLDLGVSGGHCMHYYRNSAMVKFIDANSPLYRLFGLNAGLNGNVGLCGVLSSFMAMYDLL